jgi:hypothetical protein
VQFRAGTTLEDALAIAHDIQDRIAAGLRGAQVLIHLEPGTGSAGTRAVAGGWLAKYVNGSGWGRWGVPGAPGGHRGVDSSRSA